MLYALLITFMKSTPGNENKFNRRRRLLKGYKIQKTVKIKNKTKELDKDIRYFCHSAKSETVRRHFTWKYKFSLDCRKSIQRYQH
jgi:hypothetical protein